MGRFVAAIAATVLVAACATPKSELEDVAKDWCLTIRASQVLPVYPPSEDVQPGDVFLVPTPLSRQTELYQRKGFLPLDQLVTRFRDIPYLRFYADAYWIGNYQHVPHARPGIDPPEPDGEGTGGPSAMAPRVAFPSYDFEIQKGGGLKLAIPVSGVPVGLGVMGASQATGSVSLKDAYTYAVDGETLVRMLYEWWESNAEIRDTLSRMAEGVDDEIYLRVVTRVFIVREITVSLRNLDSVSGGVDAGAAPEIAIIDLAATDPEQAKSAAEA